MCIFAVCLVRGANIWFANINLSKSKGLRIEGLVWFICDPDLRNVLSLESLKCVICGNTNVM